MGTWPKRIAIALAVLAPLCVVAYFVLEARGERRLREAREVFEQEVGALEPEIPTPDEVPVEDDVVALLREGARVAQEPETEKDDLTAWAEMMDRRGGPGEWSEQEVEEVEELVERNARLLEIYRQAGSRSRAAYRPEDVTGDEFSLLALRGSRLLLAEAGLALRQGDEQTALESLEAVGQIMRAFNDGPGLSHQLLGVAAEERFLRGVRWVVERPNVSTETLQALFEQLPRRDAAEAFRRSMTLEAGQMFRVYQTLGGREHLGGEPIGDWYLRLPGVVEMDAADMLDSYREFASLAEYPYEEARTTRMEALEGPRRPMPKVLLGLLFPNFFDSIGKLQAVAASRQLALAALELRIGALEGEGYPDALELEPDPFTGTRPEYVVSEDGALLRNPAARDLWQEHWGEITKRSPPPYAWNLPASSVNG